MPLPHNGRNQCKGIPLFPPLLGWDKPHFSFRRISVKLRSSTLFFYHAHLNVSPRVPLYLMCLFHQLISQIGIWPPVRAHLLHRASGFLDFWGKCRVWTPAPFYPLARVGAALIVIGGEVCAGPALLLHTATTTIFPTPDKCVKHHQL